MYKKSGPGPKNGEQYGAPFREEDWNDDCPDFNNSSNLETPVGRSDEVLSFDVTGQVQSFSCDIDEIMKQITEKPLLDLPEVNDYAHTPPSQVCYLADCHYISLVQQCFP